MADYSERCVDPNCYHRHDVHDKDGRCLGKVLNESSGGTWFEQKCNCRGYVSRTTAEKRKHEPKWLPRLRALHASRIENVFPQGSPEDLSWCILKLCAEAGELANVHSKYMCGEHDPFYEQKMREEIADVRNCLALVCLAYDVDVDECVEEKLDGLYMRFPGAADKLREMQDGSTL